LRNQTAKTIGRYENKKGSSKNVIMQKKPSMPQEITYNVEAYAVNFLFTHALSDWRASHGHLDFLQPLYLKSASSSPLALASNWVAVVMIGIRLKQDRSELESQLLSKVIKNIAKVINDPIERVKDETLQAVLLLSFGEYLRFRQHGMKPTLAVHQTGAEALIRCRGGSNFQSQASIALFIATRHNAINMAMQKIREFINWDMWTATVTLDCMETLKAPGTELDDCGIVFITLQKHLKQLEKRNTDTNQEIKDKALALLERLKLWERQVPSDWLPNTNSVNLIGYSSPEVCYMFNQWYLLQLDLSHLINEIDQSADPMCTASVVDLIAFQMDLIAKIVASECSFVICDPTGGQFDHIILASNNLSHLSAQQCYDSPFGSQLLGQTLRRLKLSISQAMGTLKLTPTLQLRYEEVLAWATEEEDAIRQAFPLPIHAT
jgi:hypothetical protein